MSEFNLSEKIDWIKTSGREFQALDIEEVREFVKRLKEEIQKGSRSDEIANMLMASDESPSFEISPLEVNTIIDKLAGDKLI